MVASVDDIVLTVGAVGIEVVLIGDAFVVVETRDFGTVDIVDKRVVMIVGGDSAIVLILCEFVFVVVSGDDTVLMVDAIVIEVVIVGEVFIFVEVTDFGTVEVPDDIGSTVV